MENYLGKTANRASSGASHDGGFAVCCTWSDKRGGRGEANNAPGFSYVARHFHVDDGLSSDLH